MLGHILTAQRILGNMVLFKCNICIGRFPTFHLRRTADIKLDVLASYPWQNAELDTTPSDNRTKYATLHTGSCLRCIKDLGKAAGDTLLANVGVVFFLLDITWTFCTV